MKKILITLLFSIPVFAQDGFKAEDNSIVWEKSFTAQNANIVPVLEREPGLEVGGFMDNVFKGYGNNISCNCNEGSGLMKNNLKFEYIIMVNPDYYVVKVKNIKIIEKYGPMQARVIANSFEKYFLDETALRTDAKSQTDINCLNKYLTGIFSLEPFVDKNRALTSNK